MLPYLTYHPAFDSYHCAYRILLLIKQVKMSKVEVDRMRIWDFYFVFPQEVKHITIPRDLWSFKKVFENNTNPYENLANPQRIFDRMKPFQLAAFNYLAAYGFIESKQLAKGIIERTDKTIPEELLVKMNKLSDQQNHVIGLISSPLNDISLYGAGGLKDRTKLLDFKYDAR